MTSDPPCTRPLSTYRGLPIRPLLRVLSSIAPNLTSLIALRSTAACSGMMISTEPHLASSSMCTTGDCTWASVKSSFVEPYLLRTTSSDGTTHGPPRCSDEYFALSSIRFPVE
jgi:hypothetical protein